MTEPRLTRRHLLCCGAAAVAGLFTSLDAGASPFRATCAGALPPELARHELVARSFDGLDAHALWDVHTHLLGTGDSGSGCTIHPAMNQWWRPTEVLRKRMILGAACVAADAPSVDRAYVDRLRTLAADFPAGARWLLFAFDRAHDDAGLALPDSTTFHVPDAYAEKISSTAPERFGWVASIHPYREDALVRLDAARAAGAVAVKWLPSAMNIDLASPRCGAFYDRLAQSGMPLIVHCGEEQAAPGAGRHDFGNPLLVRVPLSRGVRVIVAHCATLGEADDLDQPRRPRRLAFELFARIMDEREHEGRLFGDISAVFQANRPESAWHELLARQDWHPRLLHGSDYPLPGVGPLYRLGKLVRAGLLDAALVPTLEAVRGHNPLLFDLMLKRALRERGQGFDARVFATRAMFAPP